MSFFFHFETVIYNPDRTFEWSEELLEFPGLKPQL